ncbi:MAG: glycosyltransferase involved in cell wall biosynthesis [Bacteriovoracaceae bacterium]|jgi:glycosyltransferase involved in cell wall biosynthesis
MINLKSIGIVLPTLNEEKSLEKVVQELLLISESSEWDFKFVIVNDGSTDDTGKIANKMAVNPCVSVIHNKTPQNIGKCYSSGARLLDTTYITWLPTDGEIDPSVIELLLENVSEEQISIPFPSLGRESRGPIRRFLSILYQFGINKLFNLKINYFNGNSVIPKHFFDNYQFLSTGFTINVEVILYSLIVKKMKYVEVPFTLRRRNGDKEKALKIKNIINVFKSIVQLYKRYHV